MKKAAKSILKWGRHLTYYLKNRRKLSLGIWTYFALCSSKSHTGNVTTAVFQGQLILCNSPFWFLHTIDEIFVNGIYRFNSTSKSPLILDCGANIGLSVLFFKQLYPESRIVAFEPDPMVFSLLKRNVESYKLSNLTLNQAAVWKANEALSFVSDGSVGGKIGFEPSSDPTRIFQVEAVRLKDHLISKVDLLKIDIEGAEFEVLSDCASELHNVDSLFVEYHSSSNQVQQLGEMLNILSAAGFRYYIKQAWDSVKHPFIGRKGRSFDLQLNIFCYRK